MKLHIKKDGILRDIQKGFNEYFPYLKIDFFKLPHETKKLSPRNERIDENTLLSRLTKVDHDKVVEINEKMTISEFEAMMGNQTGLFVQVFRQSGRLWIETSYTDDWTLAQQNEEGKMMSSIHPLTSEKQVDWDDQ